MPMAEAECASKYVYSIDLFYPWGNRRASDPNNYSKIFIIFAGIPYFKEQDAENCILVDCGYYV